MATKFYVLNEDAPYTPPSWQGGWDLDGTVTKACDPHTFGSTTTTATRAEAVATQPYKLGVLRVVSRRLAAQTISGTVNVCLGVSESNADAEFFWRLHLYIVNAADGSVVGTLLNGYGEIGTGTEFPTTNTGTDLLSAQSLTSVVVPSGDYRLVAEIGAHVNNSHTTSRTCTIRYGARTSAQVALSDLTVGSTSTSSRAGYLEFSGTVALASDVLTNLTPETATAIPTFPYDVTQDTREGGYTYAVWYSRLATADDAVVGIWGFGDLVTYRPTVTAYAGPVAALDSINTPALNTPIQIPLTAGTTYYIRCAPNASTASPAVLLLNAQRAPQDSAPAGSILVNDDTENFPAAILSGDTGAVLRFIAPFPAGEGGDALPSGVFLVSDAWNGTLKLYDADLALVTTIAFDIGFGVSLRAQQTLERFYAANDQNPPVLKEYDDAGTLLDTHTLTSYTAITGLAANNAGTVLYHARPGAAGAISRWNLASDVALSDLAAGVASYVGGTDILVLDDDSILVSYVHPTTGEFYVRRYSTGGTVLNTYAIATTSSLPASTLPRLAYATDTAAAFMVWFHRVAPDTGVSRFQQIRVSDGTILSSIETPEFEVGAYQAAETATPLARFGVSYSCPFFVLRTAPAPPPVAINISEPCCPCPCPPPPLTPSGLPGSIVGHTGAILPPTIGSIEGWTRACTGGGDVPTAADATDAESWVS